MMFLSENTKTKLLAWALAGFMISSVYATEPKQNNPDTTILTHSDPWKIEVAPYLWALSMNGTVKLRRRVVAHVDETFSDILSQLNWAGMVWVEASKDKFGIFANAMYASLSDSASDRFISAHVNTDFGLYSAGLSYQIYKTCFCPGTSCDSSLEIAPYVGARYTSNHVSVTVNTPIGNARTSNNKGWTDPMLGLRFNLNMNKSWLAILAGDLGGTNTASDYSYNLVGMLGFKPQTVLKKTTWYLGYRLLDQHYITGSGTSYYNWNMKLFGPVVSISYTF